MERVHQELAGGGTELEDDEVGKEWDGGAASKASGWVSGSHSWEKTPGECLVQGNYSTQVLQSSSSGSQAISAHCILGHKGSAGRQAACMDQREAHRASEKLGA